MNRNKCVAFAVAALLLCAIEASLVTPSSGAISLGVYQNAVGDYTATLHSFFTATKKHAIAQYALLWDADGTTHTGIMNMVRDAGATPMCIWGSANYSFSQILSGQADNRIRDVARAVKSFGDPVILGLNAEFNLSSSRYNNPEDYKKVWKHVWLLFDSESVANVQWAWIPNYASWPAESWNNYNNYYPGDSYVHWVGALGFDCNWQGGPADNSFDALFGGILNDFKNLYPSKPQMIGWFGTAGDASYKTTWITKSYQAMQSYPNLRAVVWFNESSGANDFRVWSGSQPVSAAVTTAYKNAISSSSSFLDSLPPYDQLAPGGGGGGRGFLISLDKATAHPGESVVLTWTFNGVSQSVDAYLAVQLPDTTLLIMDSKLIFQSEIVPAASKLNVSGNPSGPLGLPLPADLDHGTYTFMSVCVPPKKSALDAKNYLGDGIFTATLVVQ